MSARVFNPVVVSELKHVRTPGTKESHANFKTRDLIELSSIRRDLFGPVDHEECKVYLERELERQQNLQTNYWEFDFVNEVPKPGRGRYVWKNIYEKINIRPTKREYSDLTNDLTHLYHTPLEDETEKEVKKPLVHINKKQAKITGRITFFDMYFVRYKNLVYKPIVYPPVTVT